MNVLVGDLVFALDGADFVAASSPSGLTRFRTARAPDVGVTVAVGAEPLQSWTRSGLLSWHLDERCRIVTVDRVEGSARMDLEARQIAVRLRGPWVRALEAMLSIAVQIFALTMERGLVLHAATVDSGRRAVAFCGRSGAGKSTAACFGVQRGARMLAEDMTYVGMDDRDSAVVCTMPFWQRGGTEPEAECLTLKRVCYLHQAAVDAVTKLPIHSQVGRILQITTIGVRHPLLMDAALDAAERLVASAPVVDLHFRKSSAFWDLMEDDGPH